MIDKTKTKRAQTSAFTREHPILFALLVGVLGMIFFTFVLMIPVCPVTAIVLGILGEIPLWGALVLGICGLMIGVIGTTTMLALMKDID